MKTKRVRISPKILTLFLCLLFIHYMIETIIPLITQIDVIPEKFPLKPKSTPQLDEKEPATKSDGTSTVLHWLLSNRLLPPNITELLEVPVKVLEQPPIIEE